MRPGNTLFRPGLRQLGALAITAAALLVLSACGGDVSDTEAVNTTTSTPSGAETTTEQPSASAPAETTPDEDFETIDPPLEIAGSSWVVTNYSYSPSNTGITNPLGEQSVVVFDDDGTLKGHTGCNEFEGTWEISGPYYLYDEGAKAFDDKIDGQPISIAAELTTSTECEGFVGEQDVDVLGALVSAEIWYLGNILGDEEGGITLHSETGRIYADPA